MNKNVQTYIYSCLIFLGTSFLIFISKPVNFKDFGSLLGLLAVIQVSFILSSIGIFLFQNIAFMKKEEEINFYKKKLPKLQMISYLIALIFFAIASSVNLTVVVSTVLLILVNCVLLSYLTSVRMMKLMDIKRQLYHYFSSSILAISFVLLTIIFNPLTVAFFVVMLLSQTVWNCKMIISHNSKRIKRK